MQRSRLLERQCFKGHGFRKAWGGQQHWERPPPPFFFFLEVTLCLPNLYQLCLSS